MYNQETFDRLFKIADRQQGCFTAAQARSVGYSKQSQYHHVKAGDWEKLNRAIFRLKYYPRPRRLGLLTYLLWTLDSSGKTHGVFSHDTALSLYPYSVWNPVATHITVPHGFVKRAKPPGEVVLHRRNLKPSDITMVDGVQVTTPLRTLADLMTAGFVAQYHLVDFIRTSLAAGVITDEQVRQAELTESEWSLVIPLLEKASYHKVHEIQIKRRIPAGA
jgi:predicted transcriptional regulator of viral defense system